MMKRSALLLAFSCLLVARLSAQDMPHVNYDASGQLAPFYLSDFNGDVSRYIATTGYISNTYAQYVKNNEKDANAWLQYYRSTRYYLDANNKTTFFHPVLDTICMQMKENVGGTYQQEFVEYWNSSYDKQFYPGLLKAYANAKDDPEVLRQLIGAEMINGDLKAAARYTAEWKNTGDMPQSVIDYAYDVLQSCADNAVLITNGEYDSYPLVYWQEKMKVRMDVKIVPLHLCERSDDRASIFRNTGLSLPGNDSSSVFNTDYFKRVVSVNSGTKFYLASTLPSSWMTDMSGDLYVCGLAMRYGTDEVNNLEFLKNNVGTKMMFTLLKTSYNDSKNNFDQNFAAGLSMNYVLPLAMAAQQYAGDGSKKKAEELREMVRQIGVKNDRTTEVEQILSEHQ